MTLDPQAQALLERIAAANAPLYETLPAPAARTLYETSAQILGGELPELFAIADIKIPGPDGAIAAKHYRPNAEEGLPILVFYHGGGYVIGSPRSHDVVCRELALQANCIVVSIDYRLAPEHKFPAAVDDAWAALQWVALHGKDLNGDPSRLAVGGDSAGGNLAAVVSLMARDANSPALAFQLLIYPGTDLACSYDSHKTFGSDYLLTKNLIDWFMNHYFAEGEDRSQWRASPMNAESHAHLPPAFLLSAGFDPLQDEEAAYVAKLKQAGIDIEHSHYEGMVHGFITMPGVLQQARNAITECAEKLKVGFAKANG